MNHKAKAPRVRWATVPKRGKRDVVWLVVLGCLTVSREPNREMAVWKARVLNRELSRIIAARDRRMAKRDPWGAKGHQRFVDAVKRKAKR
jgi:hypothetical protein